MPNHLDQFIERGNIQGSPIIDDEFVWQGTTYKGTISDLSRDLYFGDEASGKRNNAERMLEYRRSQFTGAEPQINDEITNPEDGIIYRLIEVDSKDTTNTVWRIRQKI